MIQGLKNKFGQIAVLLAMSFGLMALLVAMVINIGFLVAAKINLQNSVDMAAYAGAAQQARYLTEIGKWNYEMRRNYKAMVFDYLLTYSAEFKTPDNMANNEYRMYINNSDPSGGAVIRTPWVCASLQGSAGDPNSSVVDRTVICQKVNAHSFQDAIDTATNLLIALEVSQGLICAINPGPSCASIGTTFDSQLQAVSNIQAAQAADLDTYGNYKDEDPLNYTRRLIAWMLHDYRHLQSRIRGVHFGDISLGKRTSPTQVTGRWDLFKDKTNVQIFSNSPMSVAAKVINGFTSTDSTQTKFEEGKATALEGELLKNPANEAASRTFKNNLLTVISEGARLYHLAPQKGGVLSSDLMGDGCSGQCPEFTGPYLKLNKHDVNFKGYYTAIKTIGTTVDSPVPAKPVDIGNFPVGVAKDNRILTYYTVVGTARTDKIPLNVFFGEQESSDPDVLMVAVAAARPFGSRIGPYIDDTCTDLYDGANYGNCIKNGLDPLYPFKNKGDNIQAGLSNFSIWDPDTKQDTRSLGVKLSVGDDEYRKETTQTYPGSDAFSEFYGKARKLIARARDFRFKKNSNTYERDDGFGRLSSNRPPVSSTDFFDHDDTAIHPQGNRNSVWAWDNSLRYQQPGTINQNERVNYEGYLKKAQSSNPSLYKFAELPKRKTAGGPLGEAPYSVYVFRYPDPKPGSKWDIGGLTSSPREYGSMMEYAFANTMSVNLFELKRYIIPSRAQNSSSTLQANVLNYMTDTNTSGNIYGGAPNRSGAVAGLGNKTFDEVVPGKEDPDNLGSAGESYTSWRIGSRGYKVKLVNVNDLVSNNTNCSSRYKNCLNTSYTIDDTGGKPVTVDLSKIFY